ncbi:MAG: glycosyltransferase family 2 protein, partial [Sphingobacteriaceae bacterium]
MDISVIIPYYNAGNYLPDAINSVRFLLDRSDIACEIVIADDGSTDAHSIEILAGLEKEGLFTIVHQSNKGPGAARNTAVRNSTGKYLLFLDSDNKIRPRLVEKGLEILNSKRGDI